jgi:glyoxylase-like metal-dependent hydrolase (beta-lactamase superfamily II)
MPAHRHDAHDHGHHHGHHPDGHAVTGHSMLHARPRSGARTGVHPIGRRRFLADLGRNTFAVALLGGLAAACSGDGGDGAAGGTPSGGTAAGASGTAWAQVDLGFVSAYVIVRGNEAAVVDTGDAGNAARIGETLTTLGVTLDDVRHVVVTHSHPDHVGSLDEVLGQAPSASAYAGEADIPAIDAPIEIAAVFDGDDVFGLQVIETPGHTPGSISVLDPGIGLLVAGDALNGNDDGTAVLGPNERFTADMATANASVDKLAALDFDIVAFGHGQPVTSGAADLVRALP